MDKPLVAIVTRTRDRPLLLKRAAASVAAQTYEGYLWIVVNDGGDEAEVRRVIDSCPVDRRRIRLISHAQSRGMEAASNTAIAAFDCEYVLIHDDDDSLEKTFAERCVAFLESTAGRRYGGVMTQSMHVSETILGDSIVEHERMPYKGWVRNVQFGALARENLFPPIAFVYRRALWEKIGGYNEELPVLGDWFFNLEFLLEADIGVIYEPLAFYHHRDREDSSFAGSYANSLTAGRSKHEEFAAVMRNIFLRKYAAKNPAAAAMVGAGEGGSDATRAVQPTENDPDELIADIADRAWMCACINADLGRAPSLNALLPSAGWEEILARIPKSALDIPIPAHFDEERYLANNPDVAAAVRSGETKSGYAHYVRYGRAERRPRCTRRPSGGLDPFRGDVQR